MKLLWLILFCPVTLFGQQISGIIRDEESTLPVEFATIYFDGTTIGTITGSDGEFLLERLTSPGKIVVSHVSYNTEVIELEEDINLPLIITLTPKITQFEQVSKSSISRRAENLEYFQDMFLGYDYWGTNAVIENDSVISFSVEYAVFAEPGEKRKIASIEVKASAPIKISLPKLGYTLHFDLVHFIDRVDTILNRRVISTLGYFYYQEMQPKNRVVEREYRSNRMEAFYFSPQHFVRSFSNNQLLENGYLLYEQIDDSIRFFYPDSCNCTSYTSEGVIITGMKGRLIDFVYFKSRGVPVDLTKSKRISASKSSSIYFKDNLCIFRKDGTLPGGSVIFDRRIGIKKIGATLPSDYRPDMRVSKKIQNGQIVHQELLKKVRL